MNNEIINSFYSYVLRECIEYFVTRGSTVFMAALDDKKAFDRVNHIKLFMKLLDNGLPVYIVRLLIDWYTKLHAAVKWEGCISSLFCSRSGVRQG